jgi:hypothetical protein
LEELTAQPAGDDVGKCEFRLIEEVVNGQGDDGQAAMLASHVQAQPRRERPNVTAAWRSFRLRF